MIRNVFIAAAVAGLIGFSAQTAKAGQQDFTIHNQTGFKITKLYVEPESNTKDWGDEILKGETIDNGEEYKVSLEGYGNDCKWAVSITDPSGTDWEVRDINLCEVSDLKFTKEGGKVKWSAN
jgi:hypothetical protein